MTKKKERRWNETHVQPGYWCQQMLAVAFFLETQAQAVVSWMRRIPLAAEKMAYPTL